MDRWTCALAGALAAVATLALPATGYQDAAAQEDTAADQAARPQATPAPEADLAAILADRREAVPRGKRAFEETWLLPAGDGPAATAEETRFGARVSVYQEAARERIEIRRAAEGGGLVEPLVIVSDGSEYHLVTKVGATALGSSAPAGDALVRLVLAGPPGEAPAHRVVEAAGGVVAAVVLRSPGKPAFDEDEAFALRLPQVGGGLLKTGLSQFSPAGNTQVTASAGARGVDQIRTANGTISVTPDPAAVQWMESKAVGAVELETFKREGRLDPYDALPEVPPGAAEPAAEAGS